ncbi:hypothetical protein FS749_000250 [Ceratobasidium sp. UAMH 11750]|nr:hypothetical protein FS749_000250 [Ceratobasidium sp. UAMH 11750]
MLPRSIQNVNTTPECECVLTSTSLRIPPPSPTRLFCFAETVFQGVRPDSSTPPTSPVSTEICSPQPFTHLSYRQPLSLARRYTTARLGTLQARMIGYISCYLAHRPQLLASTTLSAVKRLTPRIFGKGPGHNVLYSHV